MGTLFDDIQEEKDEILLTDDRIDNMVNEVENKIKNGTYEFRKYNGLKCKRNVKQEIK